jgi:hypothetical protein
VNYFQLLPPLKSKTTATVNNPSSTGEKPSDGWKPDPNTGYLGAMFLSSFSVTAPYEGQATYSAEFTGSGPLKPMSVLQTQAYISALEAASEHLGPTAKAELKSRAKELEVARETKEVK